MDFERSYSKIVLQKKFVTTNSCRHCNSPKTIICYLFRDQPFGSIINLSGTLRMKVFFQNISGRFTEDRSPPFLIKSENDHPLYLYLYQTTYDIFSQLQFMPIMVLRAISPIWPTDDNFGEKNSNHSIITENLTMKKSKQIFHTDNQYQTRTNSFLSNPNTTILPSVKVYLLL